MRDVLVIGSINMDQVLSVKQMPQRGETVFASAVEEIPGGKGANQAIAAARLGSSVVMVGKVGKDAYGDAMLSYLEKDRVDIGGIKRSEYPTGIATILVDEEGENSIIVSSGANMDFSIAESSSLKDYFSSSKVVLLQQEIPLDFVNEVIVRAKRAGCIVILNPAPAKKMEEEYLAMIDYLIPNETELEILTDTKVTTEESCRQAVEMLLQKGAKRVIVTLGKKGCYLRNREKELNFSGYRVKAVDTTAAGDSFVGAFAGAIARGVEEENAVDFAQRAAAISVTRKGAQTSIPTKQEVDEWIW